MVLLQLWYLTIYSTATERMPLFFTATVSVRESEGDAVEYGEMDWERKESYTSYISMGRSSPGSGTKVCSPAQGG